MCAGGVASTTEEDAGVGGEECVGVMLGRDAATSAAELANQDKIVLEGRNYFAFAGWDVNEEMGSHRGGMWRAGGVLNPGGGCG